MAKQIKPSFKKVSKEERNTFSSSHCLLNISVGQASQDDQRFAATIELINKTFLSCTISLNDTLQRHTMALSFQEKEPKELREKALELGNLWLERNSKYFNHFTNKPKIIRWDEWLNNADYPHHKNQILSTLESDPAYKTAFEDSIAQYLERFASRLNDKLNFDLERARKLCMGYLVEECATLPLLAKSGYHFELYAGSHPQAIEETKKRFVAPRFPGMTRSVKIGFNSRPDLAAQQFDLQGST